ncbi:MAG TPA: DUF4282 domain-containing protein [Thermoguttaceae bacterium]
MEDFFSFRKMIAPLIVQSLFWIMVILTVITGIMMLFTRAFFYGIMVIIFYPIFLRISAELILLAFKIYDRLNEISETLKAGK